MLNIINHGKVFFMSYILNYFFKARNAEKAMTALARWRRMKEQEEKGPVAKRPSDVKECKNVNDAERFRKEIVMDISKKIAMIQVIFLIYKLLHIFIESWFRRV